jgi:hypothetical protein
MTAPRVVSSITIATATVDGVPLAVYRTRVLPNTNTIIADAFEASDMDAFNAPIDDQPGITLECYPQESPHSNIPEVLWAHLFDGLVERISLRALTRRATCDKTQINLGTPPPNTNDAKVLLPAFYPSHLANQLGLNHINPNTVTSQFIHEIDPSNPEVILDFDPDLSDYLKPGQTPPF